MMNFLVKFAAKVICQPVGLHTKPRLAAYLWASPLKNPNSGLFLAGIQITVKEKCEVLRLRNE